MVRSADVPSYPFTPAKPLTIQRKQYFTARQLGEMLGYNDFQRENVLRLYVRNKRRIPRSESFLVKRADVPKSERVFSVQACLVLAQRAQTAYKQETIAYLQSLTEQSQVVTLSHADQAASV